VKDKRHIFKKEWRVPSEFSGVRKLRNSFYDPIKAVQGEEEIIILKMNQQVREINVMRCRRDTDSSKSFVYTPSAVLGLS
jgi:hypothetical protein